MTIQEIIASLDSLRSSDENSYQCFKVGNNLYGKNSENNVVFITKSKNFCPVSIQHTKYLILTRNISCTIQIKNQLQKGRFDVITCLSNNSEHIKVFIELTNLYINKDQENSITDYFICLKDLFTNKQKISSKELQGLYAELYMMHYMYHYGVDLYSLWQSTDRMKFDFSVNDIKKIEVKSTIGENRIHKFRHEQLVTDIFDVWIVSTLLRKDDQGLSLYELANIVKDECSHSIKVFTHIENLLLNYTKEDLQKIKFNKTYTDNNMAFYKAADLPRFKSKQPDGVSNTEYDSDLNNINSRTLDNFIVWLKN